MCGIAGILDFSGRIPDPRTLRAMTRLQRHRGPDGEGYFGRSGVALGHCRLSIIDPSGGQQPLANEDGQVWVTYNGEIYNFRELRRQLEQRGHDFRSACDSEVIVHAYEQWGEDCVRFFRGMFAFALVDFRRRRLLLARDHLGIKPLYYRLAAGYLAFSSELRPLCHTEGTLPSIDVQALDYYLRYRYVPAPTTVYQGVHRLAPAHVLVCDFDGHVSQPREYWRLRFQPEARGSEELWLEEFESLLEASVRDHLVSDVPLGAFLSGGVDSTLVVGQMARLLDHPVKAFSIGFDEDAYSELEHARQAAQRLGVQLHTQIVRPDVVGIFDQLFARYGEPFADTSAVPTWCVSQLARRHVSMVLSGDGADEAFAGYGRYDTWMKDGWWQRLVRASRHPKQWGRWLWQYARSGGWTPLDRWQRRYVGVCDAALRAALWRPEYGDVVSVESPAFARAGRQAPVADRLAYAQYLDIKTYLPGDILTKVDVASMCHGLEVRTPLCDVRVMEFAARLPQSLRRGPTSGPGARLKVLPKQSLARTFPERFVQRPKQGFAIPEAAWLRPGTMVRRCFEDLVMAPSARINDYFQPAQIRHLVGEFDQRGREPTALWLLLILSLWLEHHHGVLSPPADSHVDAVGRWDLRSHDRRFPAAVA